MSKKPSNYSQSRAKIRQGQSLSNKDMVGKLAHQFRATMVGRRNFASDKKTPTLTKTSVFPLDIPSDILSDWDLDRLSAYNFVLNGCTPGSLINAVLNFQVQGWSLFDSEKQAESSLTKGAIEARGPVARTRPPLHSDLIEDATIAGMLIISAQFKDLAWQLSTGAVPSKLEDSVEVSNRNALSWLLNTEGVRLMKELAVPVSFNYLDKAPEYRSHIHGKLSSWSANYISSVKSINKQALDALARFNSQDTSALSASAASGLKEVLSVYREIAQLTDKALGRSSSVLSLQEANRLVELTEEVFYDHKKKYEIEVRNSLEEYKASLKAEHNLPNKKVLLKLKEAKQAFYLAKLHKVKKIGGPTLDFTDILKAKQEDLDNKLNQLKSLWCSLPSPLKVCESITSSLNTAPTDLLNEARVRRQLDDLGRVSFGNHHLAGQVYPLFRSCLEAGPNQDPKRFLNEFLFGKPLGKKTPKVLRQKGKIARSHSEQDVEPYPYLSQSAVVDEFGTLYKLEKISNKFERSLPRKLATTPSCQHNALYTSWLALKVRVYLWKAAILTDSLSGTFGLAGPNGLSNELYAQLNNLKSNRILAGRLFTDIQNLLSDLNPPCGYITYSMSIPSAIEEAQKSISIELKNKQWTVPYSLESQLVAALGGNLGEYSQWATKLTAAVAKIPKNRIYEVGSFKEIAEEDPVKQNDRWNTYQNKVAKAMTSAQKLLVDLMWKVPHDLHMRMPGILDISSSFRLKGVSSHKTSLAKAVARQDKISDGLYVFNFKLNLALEFKAESSSFTFSSNPATQLFNVTYNLPQTEEVKVLPFAENLQLEFTNMLAVDLNANGLGVSLFSRIELGNDRYSFQRIPLQEEVGDNGVLQYRLPDGKIFKVFHEIPGLTQLRDKVRLYRKMSQKQRKFGSFLDPNMEKFKETVVSNVLKCIEQLMFTYRVGYLAFENEVSNLESGEAQLRTVYKSVLNYFVWPENDARRAAKKAFWQGEGASVLKGANGEILKFHPGAGVRAFGTSQICSECRVNPLDLFWNPNMRISETHTTEGSSLVFTGTSPETGSLIELKITATEEKSARLTKSRLFGGIFNGDTYKYTKLLNCELSEEIRRKLRSAYKTKFMRTELVATSDTRSTQSKYVCYNSQCSCYGKDRDADHNAANNIGQRLIDKLSRTQSYSDMLGAYVKTYLSDEKIKHLASFLETKELKTKAKVSSAESNPLFFAGKTLKLKKDTPPHIIAEFQDLLVAAGVNDLGGGAAAVDVKISLK